MPKKKHPRRSAKTVRVAAMEAQPESGGQRVGSLLVVQGADVDLGRHVVVDHSITIGRDETVELPLADGSTSRHHCRVERDERTGSFIIIDLESTNGTSLNGRRIQGICPLAPGDKIFLGASVVRFSFSDGLDVRYHSKLEAMVSRDALTGLAARRQYDATFAAMAERAAAEGSALSLVVMDMDGLKTINDTYGHEMGGWAIVEVASIVGNMLEEHGIVCRYGGDEFVGCFAGMDRERAFHLADEVRRQVETCHFSKAGIVVRPTLSIGVAAYPDDTDDPHTLFRLADRALYRAKNSGRNCVAVPES